MSDIVIRVENLSKCYTIRHQNGSGEGLRHAIHDFATAPLRWLRGGVGSWVPGIGLNGHAQTANIQNLAPNTQNLTPNPQHPTPTEEFWALKDVSFEVKRGEVVGIIGRNGAGKSTLLKILSRITEPTSGRVRIRGRVASLLEVGTGFHPELTGRENIFVNGAILGMTRAEIQKKFDEIVAFAEVEKFLDTPVKWYSSGMYVRLAFAVAAHLDPEILIVDEVLAVGDTQFQKKCLGKMHDVATDQGRTVLFVSHNMNAIIRLCSRVLQLDNGKVAFSGRTSEGVDRYLESGQIDQGSVARLDKHGWVSGAPVMLRSLCINDGNAIVNGRRLIAILRFEAQRPIEKVGFGLGLCGLDGRRILTFDSDHSGNFFSLVNSGQMIVELDLPKLDLVPGRYHVDVGAYGESHQCFHYAPECVTIEVQPGCDTPAHWEAAYGDVRPRVDWRLNKSVLS